MNPEKKYNFLLALTTMIICIIVGSLMNFLVNFVNGIPLFPLRRGLLTLTLFTLLGILVVALQFVDYFYGRRRR
jgi:hypothetical protein